MIRLERTLAPEVCSQNSYDGINRAYGLIRAPLAQLGREPSVSIRKNILLNAGYLERRFESFKMMIPYFCVRTFFRACLEHVTHADSQCRVTPPEEMFDCI